MEISELKPVMFSFMLNFLEKMNNLIEAKTQIKSKTENRFQLTQTEIEIILNILKEGSFPVKNIEELYRALIKLQEQHKLLNK